MEAVEVVEGEEKVCAVEDDGVMEKELASASYY